MGNINSFQKEFGLLIVGAIVFTASFLWKDLLSDIQDYYFPKKYGNIIYRILFIIFVTTMLIFLAIYLRNILGLEGSNSTNIQFDDSPIDDDQHNIDISHESYVR